MRHPRSNYDNNNKNNNSVENNLLKTDLFAALTIHNNNSYSAESIQTRNARPKICRVLRLIVMKVFGGWVGNLIVQDESGINDMTAQLSITYLI